MGEKAPISVLKEGGATLLCLNIDSRSGGYETKGQFLLRLTPEDLRWLLAELTSK